VSEQPPDRGDILRSVEGYDLVEEIGRGAAALVYKAWERDMRRYVALKQLSPFQLGDRDFAARFIEEARVAGSLKHPNIITVYKYFEHDGTPYIAMEYLQEGSLRGFIGHLSFAQIAGILQGVLAGLGAAERANIVHRDLKPENLLVSRDGTVKIVDFGIAKAMHTTGTKLVKTLTGSAWGTPSYMSPEQANGGVIGPRSDLYSLGVVAWEMTTGRVPFEETETPVALLYRHVHEPVPPVHSLVPGVDDEFAGWIERLLAKDPADRFASARESWDDLEEPVLRLLGPRWHRQAALLDEEGAILEASLAWNSPDDAAAGNEVATPDASAHTSTTIEAEAPTAEQEPPTTPESDTAGAPPTILGEPAGGLYRQREPPPASSPAAEHEQAETNRTILGGRQRPEPPEKKPEPKLRDPRRRAIAMLIAATVAAAALGVLIGQSGRGKTHLLQAATVSLQESERPALAAILRSVATTRTEGLARMSSAKSPTTQLEGATTVADAYQKGAEEISALGQPRSGTALAKRLSSTLTTLSAEYARLAAAVHSANASAYAKASMSVTRAEETLREESQKLTVGNGSGGTPDE
jgi:serine/threonine protein kinase